MWAMVNPSKGYSKTSPMFTFGWEESNPTTMGKVTRKTSLGKEGSGEIIIVA